MPMEPVRVRWRRLDLPGIDVAELGGDEHTWRLTGTADFSEGSAQCHLSYAVLCAADWTTLAARVNGDRGGVPIAVDVARSSAGRWSIGGHEVPAVPGSADIDLAFTPATNLIPLRRLNLAIGQEGEAMAAWLTFPDFSLRPLRQKYRRTSPTTYAYSAPELAFQATLTVTDQGFVREYPGLWRAEPQVQIDSFI
jgi:hypothetical protein